MLSALRCSQVRLPLFKDLAGDFAVVTGRVRLAMGSGSANVYVFGCGSQMTQKSSVSTRDRSLVTITRL